MIEIVALSEEMREAVRLAERVAASDANLLVTGESGAGKDVLASFIHMRSQRAAQPLVKIDCATLPADLLEAELSGTSAARLPAPPMPSPAAWKPRIAARWCWTRLRI